MGLDRWHIPIAPGQLSLDDAATFTDAVRNAKGPVLAFCRTGARSIRLWTAAQGLCLGRHASLALPGEDAGLVEWSWGDWNWFALEHTGILEGLQALFASPRSTLSRRELTLAEDADELAARVGAEEVLHLDVERERARMLLRDLEARWRRDAARR